jgi:hypothetical protein
MDGWVDGWVGVKAVLRIAYSNKKTTTIKQPSEQRVKQGVEQGS